MTAPDAVGGDGAAGTEDRVERLWRAALAGDSRAAVEAVLGALEAGAPAEDLLLDVVGGVQRRVGEEWAGGRIDVAQEHTATAINDRAITAVALAAPRVEPVHGRVAVACVDGEWHAFPARLLAEVLVLRGFTVDYLGAQVPSAHLVEHLHRTGPAAVALSGSLATRLPTAHATIDACVSAGTPVIAGGAAFGVDGRYARLLGAQAWAPDARAAAALLAAGPPGPRQVPGQPVDRLPHLADQEYTMVARTQRELVKAVYAGLEERFPVVRAEPDAQRERTAEDLAHIVEFLATALYVDVDALFTDFLGWTAGVLGVRGVSVQTLVAAVDLLADELRDFPRARRILDRGRAALLVPAGAS